MKMIKQYYGSNRWTERMGGGRIYMFQTINKITLVKLLSVQKSKTNNIKKY